MKQFTAWLWLSAVDSWLNDVGFPAVVKLAGRCLRPPDTDFNGIGPENLTSRKTFRAHAALLQL